jgi:hypothetical protein
MRGPFLLVVVLEVLALFLVSMLAYRLHRPDLAPDWCAMVMGLHFLPLATSFRAPSLGIFGVLTTLWCLRSASWNSIAQLIANQLQRIVFAPAAGTFFTVSPNSTLSGGTSPQNLPGQIPIYLLQDFGKPFGQFLPPLGH